MKEKKKTEEYSWIIPSMDAQLMRNIRADLVEMPNIVCGVGSFDMATVRSYFSRLPSPALVIDSPLLLESTLGGCFEWDAHNFFCHCREIDGGFPYPV